MQLDAYIDTLRQQLVAAGTAGGDDARALADRLTAPLESAFVVVMLEALSTAAEEITAELAPGSVEVRLRGREPHFVVTLPPAEDSFAGAPHADGPHGAAPPAPPPPPLRDEEGNTSRFNLRLPESLKARVEDAAAQEGLSLNTWLVRAAAAALDGNRPRGTTRNVHGGQHFTGWVT